jgi:hypothetical protein
MYLMNESYSLTNILNRKIRKDIFTQEILFSIKLWIKALAKVHMVMMFVVKDIDFLNQMELYHQQ